MRSVEAGNRAIDYLNLGDLDIENMDDGKVTEEYERRWESAGEIVITTLNFIWPEVEALAMKLGVPFEPEIMALFEEDDE